MLGWANLIVQNPQFAVSCQITKVHQHEVVQNGMTFKTFFSVNPNQEKLKAAAQKKQKTLRAYYNYSFTKSERANSNYIDIRRI